MASLTMLLVGCQTSGVGDLPSTPAPSREGSSPQIVATSAPFGVATLVAAFGDTGLETSVRPARGWSIFGPKADDYVLSVGTRHVSVFVFATGSIARRTASRLSKDDPFPLVEFVGRPHVFARGRVIALFVESRGRTDDQPIDGRDGRVLEILTGAMGAQVAGW
jgi:hypothetical protein